MHKLPDLPYDFDALEPVISAEIMELHYSKHHNAYVTNLNSALEKYEAAEKKGDLGAMIALEKAIRFNGGGHINHSIFWQNLAPVGKGGGGEPSGALKQAMDKQFGSFDAFVKQFNTKTAAIQGSGWGWLAYCSEHDHVIIVTCENQDPVSTKGVVPLLGVDVWEHAYYLDYKNARPKYLENIWKVVNWKDVEKRYSGAKS